MPSLAPAASTNEPKLKWNRSPWRQSIRYRQAATAPSPEVPKAKFLLSLADSRPEIDAAALDRVPDYHWLVGADPSHHRALPSLPSSPTGAYSIDQCRSCVTIAPALTSVTVHRHRAIRRSPSAYVPKPNRAPAVSWTTEHHHHRQSSLTTNPVLIRCSSKFGKSTKLGNYPI